jgi:hypothetical protein
MVYAHYRLGFFGYSVLLTIAKGNVGQVTESNYPLSNLPFEYVEDAVWLDDGKLILSIRENSYLIARGGIAPRFTNIRQTD